MLDKKLLRSIYNVGKTTINHPPNHHFYRWYKLETIPKWVVYGIGLTTLLPLYGLI